MIGKNFLSLSRSGLWAVAGLLALLSASAANATFVNPFSPTEDAFTLVEIATRPFNGFARVGEANAVGTTTFDGTIIAENALGAYSGQVDGDGIADYVRLGAKLTIIDGLGISEGSTRAWANDFITVTPPAGIAPGTSGTMMLAYRIDGRTVIDYNAAAIRDDRTAGILRNADAGLGSVLFLVTQTMDGAAQETLYLDQRTLMTIDDLPTGTASTGGPHNAILSHVIATVPVNFNYGEEFRLSTSLRVNGLSDGAFDIRQTDYINQVDVDFRNTVELIAIVNELHPDAEVIGATENYNHLRADAIPQIPLPGALWLFGSALLFMVRTRWSS